MKFYLIEIAGGIFNVSHTAEAQHASPEDYFRAELREACPPAVPVSGWPFSEIYIAQGDAENGIALAWE